MSKQKRSRALLRNLRKQAREGTLSARERRQLVSQEKKFRKARKSTAKGVGAGLAGAAALLATPAGQRLMSEAKDFMGRASDRRDARADSRLDRRVARADERSKKEAEKLEELAGVRMAEGADRIEEAEREEDRQKLLARADEFERQERERVTKPVTDVDFGMGPEGPTRDEFDAYRRQRAEELGSQVDEPRVFDAYSLSDPYTRKTVPGKRMSYLPSKEEALGFADQEPDVDDKAGIDRFFMAQDAGLDQTDYTGGFSDPNLLPFQGRSTTGERPEFSSTDLLRRGGPRVQEDGGKVEYGIGGAILGGINALRSGKGVLGAVGAATKGFVTPGSGIAQAGKLAGGLLAGSQNPALAKFGDIAQAGSSFLPGGGGVMSFLPQAAGLFSGEQGMKVAEMKDGGRAANLKKMIARKYGFR